MLRCIARAWNEKEMDLAIACFISSDYWAPNFIKFKEYIARYWLNIKEVTFRG